MKVFVTGGTGFVGLYLLEELLNAGHTVRCLVRPGSEGKLPLREGIEVRLGDATDSGSLEGCLEGCDAMIHLVGIIREFPVKGITFSRLHTEATRNVLAAAAPPPTRAVATQPFRERMARARIRIRSMVTSTCGSGHRQRPGK